MRNIMTAIKYEIYGVDSVSIPEKVNRIANHDILQQN